MESKAFNSTAVEWIVLSKAPVAGFVKTRLIPAMGEQAACDVYCQLLKRLQQTLRQLITNKGGYVALWVAGDCNHEAFNPWSDITTYYQQPAGTDLGERMAMAVQSSLSRGRIPVLIGVDVPDLTEIYLNNCLDQLANHDLVISPAEDGGYGLLGMKQFYSELFANKNWGTNTVFESTKSDIESLKISTAYLPLVWDVDEIADVERFMLTQP
jgi:rSAM/selenodomain-associated transferase 1